MDKTQADAVSQAILEPHLREQETRASEIRARREAAAALHARKRLAAWFALGGMGVGAAIAYFSSLHFAQGLIWGGLAGAALAVLVRQRRA